MSFVPGADAGAKIDIKISAVNAKVKRAEFLKPCRNLSSCTVFDMFDRSWKGQNILEGDVGEIIASRIPFMSVVCVWQTSRLGDISSPAL